MAKVFALALLMLAVTASTGSAAGPARVPIGGVVPHAGGAHLFAAFSRFAPAAAPTGPLVLQTQPCDLANSCWVMRTNTIYAIYWIPTGKTCGGTNDCTTYENGVNQYFTDVAAASGQTDNVYSAATQYYDATGPISYSSSFAGSYVDTNPYPANGCDDTFNGHTDPFCLTDQQIETEIQNVLTAKGWHGSTTTMFFLLTPDTVGSCFLPGTVNSDPYQACSTNVYCAYHSGFNDSNNEPVIYGNEPFNATITGCHDINEGNGAQGSPNDPSVDPSLNTISHEQNEAITDPWLDAWYSKDGNENGDLCAWNFGATQGTTGQEYNQTINGHHYSLQQEYTNDGLGCVQHYLGVPVNFGVPTVSGTVGQGHVLSAANGLWSQSPTSYAYVWQRCAANGTGCASIPNAVAGTYTIGAADTGNTIRVQVSAHNTAGTSAPVASAVTAAVVPLPSASVAPAVSGVAAVHQQLSTTNGTWNTAVNFTYAWLRCSASATGCAVIPGATAANYVLTAADAGHTLKAHVLATNTAGTTAADSNASGLVVDVPAASAAPHVSGRAKVAKKLTAGKGSWSGAPTSYRFQWLRCNAKGGSCKAIGKATQPTYKLTKRDAKHRLRIRVTAVNAAGDGIAISSPTATVKR